MTWNSYWVSVWAVLGLAIGLAGFRKKDKMPVGFMSWAAAACLLYWGFGMAVSFLGAWAAGLGGWIRDGIRQGGWVGYIALGTAIILTTATAFGLFTGFKDIIKDRKRISPPTSCACSSSWRSWLSSAPWPGRRSTTACSARLARLWHRTGDERWTGLRSSSAVFCC